MQSPREVSYVDFEQIINGILNQYTPIKQEGVNNYMLTCPLCGGQHLHFQYSDRINQLHCFDPLCGKERRPELIARLKTDGFDVNVVCTDPRLKAKTGKKNEGLLQNIPAHEQLKPDWWQGQYLDTTNKDGSTKDSYAVTHCYPYCTKEGWVVFYQLRANYINEKGEPAKLLKYYSSIKDTKTGKDAWAWRLILNANRPLYNLKELTDHPNKPVLLVEGEKAVEAAKAIFPDYVVTTYSGGVGAWRNTSFLPLKGRDVTLWPDNKQEAIDKFLEVAEVLDAPKIVFTTEQTDREPNWDLADELPATALDNRAMLEAATPVEKKKDISPENEAEIAAKYNEHLRVLAIAGGLHVYDKNIIIPNDPWLPYSYMGFADLPRIYPEKIAGLSRKPLYAVDAWKDSALKTISRGITYDPSTTEELLKNKYGNYETNKFLGWEHEAKECDPKRYDCFIEHVRHIMDATCSEYLLSFIAHLIQQPKQKPGVFPILVGRTITGKTMIGNILQAMLGERNVLMVDGQTFVSKWSGQFSGKVCLYVNEFTTHNMSVDFINTLLTDKMVTLEHKNRALLSEPSYHRAIGTTNDGSFVLSADDRRMFPIEIVNKSIDSHNKHNPNNRLYFKRLDALYLDDEGLCGLHHYFKNYQIQVDVLTPPKTEFRAVRMVQANPVHAIIYEMCESGALPPAFGKTVQGYVNQEPGDGRTPAYPFCVYRADMIAMLRTMYPKTKASDTQITQDFMKFIAPVNPERTMRQAFIRDGQTNPEMPRKARIFELPPLAELRARYNKLVDPLAVWPNLDTSEVPDVPAKGSHLRLVKNEDPDDGSPI